MRRTVSRICIVAIVIVHMFAAAAWWHGMPRGFPVTHAKWWVNEVFPPIVLLAGLVALVSATFRRDWRWPVYIALAYSTAWCGAAVALAMIFPTSGLWKSPFGLIFGLIGIRSALVGPAVKTKFHASASILVGFAFGLAAVALQRSADPTTHPTNVPIPAGITSAIPANTDRTVRLTDHTALWPRDREIQARIGGLQLTVEPALQFISRSPDRFWTLLAPSVQRVSPPTELVAIDIGESEARMAYSGDFRSSLRVLCHGDTTEIESAAELARPIYSHLNSYCRILVAGHRRIFVAFSPCPEIRIEVLPSDYPIGRPARAAFLSAAGVFRVVEARNAEKGPFRVLAEGPLQRGQALSLDLFDEDRPAARITMLDWSAQADTSLSPTAGWGVPCNAIEFSLVGERPSDGAAFYVTLAGTSLGRGWDSVGHSAGSYWNRMRIEP